MQENTNETKAKIITVAHSLIRKKGYDQVTIMDICESAQISKHTFYYYFDSKEDLLLKFFHIPRDITNQRMASIISIESPFEQFWCLLEPRIDHFVTTGPEIIKRVFIANLSRDIGTFDRIKMKHPFFDLEISLIEKAQKTGEVGNKNKANEMLYVNFVNMIGLAEIWAIANGNFNLKKQFRAQIEILFDLKKELRWERKSEDLEFGHDISEREA